MIETTSRGCFNYGQDNHVSSMGAYHLAKNPDISVESKIEQFFSGKSVRKL